MGNIRKLPFLSGCSAAILAGIISFAVGVDNRTIYIRMAVMMFLFYGIGVLVKNAVLNTQKEIEEKKKEMEQEEARSKRKQKEEPMQEAPERGKNTLLQDERTVAEPKEIRKEYNPDLEEEFRALSDVILTRTKE
ncbi:MAG TPA: hypothetical protein PK127_03555 [Clostridiales bacterium]|nr:hypothetical protein [Clostridiales bacterium]HPV01544.1 hypothetical protein [Clostridiales bacterium]